MTEVLGADVAALDHLAVQLRGAAAQLDEVAARWTAGAGLLAAGAWTGADAERLSVGALAALRRRLQVAGAELRRAGTACRRHADEQRRAAAPAPEVVTLRRSTRGDGRSVRRVGPAAAGTVVALVPGVGTDGGDVDRLLADAVRMQSAAWVRHGRADVAVVSWLGYDPPDTVPGALDPRSAASGALALRRDVARWHARGVTTVVLVGHSYGAVVAGRAAAPAGDGGGGGRPQALVQLGAPGVGPAGPDAWRSLRRDDLRWAAARAPGDPIGFASPWAVPWYGPDPVHLTRRLATSSHGHGGYLEDPVVLDALVAMAGRPPS